MLYMFAVTAVNRGNSGQESLVPWFYFKEFSSFTFAPQK